MTEHIRRAVETDGASYVVTYGDLAGAVVNIYEHVFLTFPTGDVILEHDADEFLAANPHLADADES